jgi:hypothetical protein
VWGILIHAEHRSAVVGGASRIPDVMLVASLAWGKEGRI